MESNVRSERRLEIPFVDLAAQYRSIETEINEAISKVLRRSDFILGRAVEEFESDFATFCGAKYAVGVDSGMSALELALRAYGIGPGDEVITTANTFIASALAISHTGAQPVLVDADPNTYTMDVFQLEHVISPRTRAVMPVHLYGHPADMDRILAFAQKYDLVVIEDACQAHGALYKGKRTGSLGHVAAFSFYPGKNLGCYGDGGAVVTNDEQIAAKIKCLRNYGQTHKYHHDIRGYNRRLDTLQAAVLQVKLRYLDSWNSQRRERARLYAELLAGSNIVLPNIAPFAEPVWHLYVIRTKNRDGMANHLLRCGISTGMHYPVPIHLQPAYEDLGYKAGAFPVSEMCAAEGLSLPMFAELTDEQVRWVADALHAYATRSAAAA